MEGVVSDEIQIANTVFQGTVLGPPLWNVFFSDVTQPAASTGGSPSLFADDLSVVRKLDRLDENSDIILSLRTLQD